MKNRMVMESLDDYIHTAKRQNWYWYQSNNEKKWDEGQATARKLEKLYSSLSDDEKLAAAKMYKDEIDISDGSALSKEKSNWDPETNLDAFNGSSLNPDLI